MVIFKVYGLSSVSSHCNASPCDFICKLYEMMLKSSYTAVSGECKQQFSMLYVKP